MKKAITILLLTLFNFPLFAGQVDDLFSSANQAYKNGNFEDAIEIYASIIDLGFESGELCYNLGNAYYKTNQLGEARLYYEKALKWMEGDEAVQQNLDLLKLRLIDQIEKPPRLFISVWWEYILNLVNLPILEKIVLGLFWLTLILMAVYMHFRKRGRLRFKGVFIVSLIIWVLVTTVWINKIYLFETEKYGIILASTVTVYSEPTKETTELFVIHEGTRVKIERASSGWYEIRLEDGKTGWLTHEILEII